MDVLISFSFLCSFRVILESMLHILNGGKRIV